MINQEPRAPRNDISTFVGFQNLLQGARGTQNYDCLRMRAQFLLS